jgi:hypothetical protein
MEQKVCFDDLPLSEALVMFVQDVSISSRQFPDKIPPVIVQVTLLCVDTFFTVVQMLQEIGQSGMTDTDWTLLMPVIATMIHQVCCFIQLFHYSLGMLQFLSSKRVCWSFASILRWKIFDTSWTPCSLLKASLDHSTTGGTPT